jgi:hypothetical protein
MKVRAAFAIFVYIVAANIPFWVASHSIGLLLTGLFNVELVFIGILSLFVRGSGYAFVDRDADGGVERCKFDLPAWPI